MNMKRTGPVLLAAFAVFFSAILLIACSRQTENAEQGAAVVEQDTAEYKQPDTTVKTTGGPLSAEEVDAKISEEDSGTRTSDDELEIDVAEDSEAAVSTDDVKEEALEALGTAKAFALQQKEEYQGRIDKKLDELQVHLEKLKAEAREKKAESKDELHEVFGEVDEKLDDARDMLKDMKSESEEAWQELKPKIDDSIEDLEKFVKDLFPTSE